ncbi:hypothetical protein TRSA_21890 (plasmid) [Treponema saccharophilum]|uniref:SNF2-related protein n=2 Tax=Treponema saccharophilum TaxID=165 RepID=H7EKY5_9SPIR|nr:SNF2-related protein [Treponema saccharophilum DSM 2985]BDC97090.1 hypothetical protein TRSA_21890 [Treponema saccharophilum]
MSLLFVNLKLIFSQKNGFLALEILSAESLALNSKKSLKNYSMQEIDVNNPIPVENCDSKEICNFLKENCYQITFNGFMISVAKFEEFFSKYKKCNFFFAKTKAGLVYFHELTQERGSRKAMAQSIVGNTTFTWTGDAVLHIENNGKKSKTVKIEKPIPHLSYSKTEHIYTLSFKYSSLSVNYADKAVSFSADDEIFVRDYVYETEIFDFLAKERFTKLAQCRMIYSGRKNPIELKSTLLSKGILLDTDENIIVPKITVSKSKGGGKWFEVDLSYELNGEIVDLASQINLFATNNEITVGDQTIIIPESIIQAREYLQSENGTLKIDKSHIFELLRIISDSGSDVSDYFSYADTNLKISDSVKKMAFPYQLDGIKWLKFLFLNKFGGCLADDMGLGKTFQVISFLGDSEVKKEMDKVLIVVPKSLLTNWTKEFEKFKSPYKVGIYHGADRKNFDFEKFDVVLTTYSTAYLDLQKLNEFVFSLAIFDEIQIVKNHKSITSDAMKQIKAKQKIGLSGTPMENGISELWNVMDILNPNVFMDHASFMRRYGNKNYAELKTILNLFILRRMKKDVLSQLPEKNEQIVYCDMDTDQRSLYTSINIAVKKLVVEMKIFDASLILKSLTLLRECCDHTLLLNEETNIKRIDESCKLDALKILVGNLVGSGHKILIFSSYTSMLKIIMDELKKDEATKDILFYLDGQTKDRQNLVNEFEAAEKGIFLISIKAGGVGLNLVSAQDVIIFDPWWNPFVEQQAIDRAYRIGQKNDVTVYKMVAANTIEEKIIEMQKNKQQDFNELINGVSTDKNFDLKDILKLL